MYFTVNIVGGLMYKCEVFSLKIIITIKVKKT